jgi:hypothetical protein
VVAGGNETLEALQAYAIAGVIYAVLDAQFYRHALADGQKIVR